MSDAAHTTGEGGLTTAQVADLVDGRLEGPGDLRIRSVSPVDQAGPDELAFLARRKYLRHLPGTRARAILVSEELADAVGTVPVRIVVKDAHAALARLLPELYPAPPPRPGIHPTAVLGRGVRLGADVSVGPYAVLEEDVVVEDGVRIGAHVVVGQGARIGEGSVLHPHVVLYPGTVLGRRVVLHAGVRLGVDGFGYALVDGKHRKVPQVGGCEIGDDVEIGANTCIDRGSIGRTVVGEGTKIDNLVHLAHNVQVGSGVLMAAMVGIAGSTRVGDGAMFGGQAGLVGHIEIGEGARIGAQAGVIGDVPAGAAISGYPARDNREYLRAMGLAFRLPETMKRLEELERRVQTLEGGGKGAPEDA